MNIPVTITIPQPSMPPVCHPPLRLVISPSLEDKVSSRRQWGRYSCSSLVRAFSSVGTRVIPWHPKDSSLRLLSLNRTSGQPPYFSLKPAEPYPHRVSQFVFQFFFLTKHFCTQSIQTYKGNFLRTNKSNQNSVSPFQIVLLA